jgi:hypothetical protein
MATLRFPSRASTVRASALSLFALVSVPALADSPPQAGAQKIAPDAGDAKSAPSLSDKLNASNGVIRPKEVDRAIEKPAPNTGAGGVIKPPGTRGGAPAPQPK